MASLRILVLAGGKSPEHEISILSAKSLLKATHGTHLEVSWLLVGRDGMWLSPEASAQTLDIEALENGSHHPGEMVHRLTEWDVVFPMIHGPTGEDGRLQALLELHGVALAPATAYAAYFTSCLMAPLWSPSSCVDVQWLCTRWSGSTRPSGTTKSKQSSHSVHGDLPAAYRI